MTEEKKEVIDIRDIVPRGYVLIPTDLYTKMVETTARYDMVEEQIPDEWCMSLLDVFNKGIDAVAYEKKQEAELAEIEAEKKRKAAEEREKAKHRCPDPGKLNSLMGAGWSVDELAKEFNAPVSDVYEWLSQLCRGEYDGALTFANMEVR